MQFLFVILFCLFIHPANILNHSQETIFQRHYQDGQFNRDVTLFISAQWVFQNVTMVDMSLVLTTFLFALLVLKRRKTNHRLYKELRALQVRAGKDSVTVGGLVGFLEEYRSKNTCMEMPLRKMNRNCKGLEIEVMKHSQETMNLMKKLESFKDNWKRDVKPLAGISENGWQQKASVIRTAGELSMLRKFVSEELQTARNIGGYYKGYVNEAEDDVDRLLISEGL